MDVQNSIPQGIAPVTTPQAAPAPALAQPDGRVSADAVASTTDPRPEVPLPMPASPSQTGLVSKSALSETETAPKLDTSGVSAAERMLKPYGINMLPEKQDAPRQETPQAP